MAFGIMNTRRYGLLYSFLASLFINCVSVHWTMWSVLTISLFMLTLTDFMFFQVRAACCVWVVVGEPASRWLSHAAYLCAPPVADPPFCSPPPALRLHAALSL